MPFVNFFFFKFQAKTFLEKVYNLILFFKCFLKESWNNYPHLGPLGQQGEDRGLRSGSWLTGMVGQCTALLHVTEVSEGLASGLAAR